MTHASANEANATAGVDMLVAVAAVGVVGMAPLAAAAGMRAYAAAENMTGATHEGEAS